MGQSDESFKNILKTKIDGFNAVFMIGKFFLFHAVMVVSIAFMINTVFGRALIPKQGLYLLVTIALIFSVFLVYFYKKGIIAGRLPKPKR